MLVGSLILVLPHPGLFEATASVSTVEATAGQSGTEATSSISGLE